MKLATIPYSDEMSQMLRVSEDAVEGELRLAAAAKFYEAGRLSSGKAAELAGLERMAFLAQLQRLSVAAINLQGDEIDAEIGAARELLG